VTVLLADGAGGFSPAPGSPFSAGSSPDSVAVADFDGNGKPDLATTNAGGNNVTVLLGNGAGAFSAAPGSPFAAGSTPTSVAVGDLNGDGKPDLTTTNASSNNVTVLLNTSPFAPRPQRTLTVTTSGTGSGTVTGPGIDCGGAGHTACSTTVTDGTQVTLTATPAADSRFTAFTGGGCGATSPCTVTMTSNQAVDAKFDTGPQPIGSVPGNTALPSISQAFQCPILKCTAIPNTYTCDPGTWDGRDPGIPYTFTWWRVTPDSRYVDGYRYDNVATGQTYRPVATSPVSLLLGGWVFVCDVQASNAAGSATARSASKTLSPAYSPLDLLNPTVDIRVTGLEVTQGIQPDSCTGCVGTLPSRDQANTASPGQANYQGVTLAAGNDTVVRVYATFTQPANVSTLPGATATLQVYDSDGHRVSTLNPDSSPTALTRHADWVGPAERANPGTSFNFVVPAEETLHRALSFRATVKPPVGLTDPAQCTSCKANTFDLTGVPFASTTRVPIHPIPLAVGGIQTTKTVDQVFGATQTVLPVRTIVFPYDAPLNADNMTNSEATYAVNERGADDGLTGSDYPIGVFFRNEGKVNLPAPFGQPGLANGLTLGGRKLYDQDGPVSTVQDDRPLTSVMHEIGHGLGLVHADTGSGPDNTGPHPDGTADCTGNSGGQVGEAWPPDNEGRIQGIGLDRRNWNIGRTGSLPQTVVEGYDGVGNALANSHYIYDFMSYCPSGGVIEAYDWISVRNWNRLVAFHPPAQALPASADRRARVASGGPVRVIATVDPAAQTSIFEVETGRTTAAGSTPGSPYRIESRDATGAVLASVTPRTTPVHQDGQPPSQLLEATLPLLPATATVVVSSGGQELARRDRSKHAPTATVLSPRRRSHVGRAATTLVRWSERDADGDRLTATVDYSRNGGHRWKVVADRLSGSSARVPSRLLAASRAGRLRVRVSDGFDVTTATSGPFVAAGAPPSVRIVGSHNLGRVRADATFPLQGAAFDDAGRPLTGRHLSWYAGRRRLRHGRAAGGRRLLGHGEHLTLRGLPVGTRSIRLLATDGHGRTSKVTLRLKVVPVPPTLLHARAPAHISATARRVRIVVASNVRAVLKIAGARHRVGPKRRTITIHIHPGRSLLRLKYTLKSPGGVMKATYVAAR
jgi:hypothetical protein